MAQEVGEPASAVNVRYGAANVAVRRGWSRRGSKII
jgi:hypothetical protein